MIKLIEKLLSLIYIQPCYFCKSSKEDTLLCSKCYSKIEFRTANVFRKINDCNIYACTVYDKEKCISKTIVRDLKYHNKRKLAKIQAKIMYDYWQQLNIKEDFLILPVPIHKNRLKERKYNHMDLVADEFSSLSGYKAEKNFLKRIKDTEKQYHLHKSERIKNLKDAFTLNTLAAPNKELNLLIIDDLTATGTTFYEIINLLRQNGYKNITALAFATP